MPADQFSDLLPQDIRTVHSAFYWLTGLQIWEEQKMESGMVYNQLPLLGPVTDPTLKVYFSKTNGLIGSGRLYEIYKDA